VTDLHQEFRGDVKMRSWHLAPHAFFGFGFRLRRFGLTAPAMGRGAWIIRIGSGAGMARSFGSTGRRGAPQRNAPAALEDRYAMTVGGTSEANRGFDMIATIEAKHSDAALLSVGVIHG
jgi:hypothetical protein